MVVPDLRFKDRLPKVVKRLLLEDSSPRDGRGEPRTITLFCPLPTGGGGHGALCGLLLSVCGILIVLLRFQRQGDVGLGFPSVFD